VVGDGVEPAESKDEGLGLVSRGLFLLELLQELQDFLVCMRRDILDREARLSLTILSRLIWSMFFWKRLTKSE
jgi:hypothetical protein